MFLCHHKILPKSENKMIIALFNHDIVAKLVGDDKKVLGFIGGSGLKKSKEDESKYTTGSIRSTLGLSHCNKIYRQLIQTTTSHLPTCGLL